MLIFLKKHCCGRKNAFCLYFTMFTKIMHKMEAIVIRIVSCNMRHIASCIMICMCIITSRGKVTFSYYQIGKRVVSPLKPGTQSPGILSLATGVTDERSSLLQCYFSFGHSSHQNALLLSTTRNGGHGWSDQA